MEYKEIAEQLIRQKYSSSEEFAINRKYTMFPDDEKIKNEFTEYYNYCEYCKKKAKDDYLEITV